jgi:hypothetical protein
MAIRKEPAAIRKAWAVGASLSGHALLAFWLWRSRPPRPTVPPPTETIEIDVQSSGAGAAGPAMARPVIRRPSRAHHMEVGRERLAAAIDRGPGTAAPVPGPTASMQLRTGAARLALDAGTLDRFERDGVIAPTVAPTDPRPARGPSFSQRLAAQLREANGRVNVEQGHVQPFLYDVVRAAQRDFKPAEGRLYADPRSPNTVARAARAWAHEAFIADPRYLAWQRSFAAKQAAAHGGALDEADVLRKYGQMIDDNAAGNAPIASVICVVLRPDAAPRIEVSASSGNGELDRVAITSLTRAAGRQPLDPGLRPQRACYHFAAAVERAAPLFISGCTFDEAKLTWGCYYPAMKVLRTNVTLASVE